MVVWDEVFEQCCTDPVKATKIRDLSYRGLPKHGRGCVLVFQEVQTRPRGAGTGFTSKPPKSSRRVPDFVTLDWYAAYLPREFLLDPRKAPNEAETAPQDDEASDDDVTHMPETFRDSNDDAVHMVHTQHDSRKDVTIDVEDIIRSAQDVYEFDSDDDDDDELDVRADDDNLNNDSLVILDDTEDASAASRIDSESLLNLDDEDDDVAPSASVSNDVYEAPLLIFDDDALVVTTPPRVEIQIGKEFSADDFHVNSANVHAQANFGAEDGAAEIAHDTLIGTEEEHGEDHVIDDTHSGKGRVKMQFNIAGGANASLSASGLDEEASGKDGANGAHGASGLNEASAYTVEVLAESIDVDASSLNGSAANKSASMDGQGMQDHGDERSENDVELVTQQMLFTSMRGMDMTRLMSLTANFDFEAEKFRFGRKMAMIDTKTMDAGGEDPYNPKDDELVLLLHLVIDGRPAYGADVVIAYRDETQIIGLDKDSWKLKGKYKL